MRGKLRDKRIVLKRDSFKQEPAERRRTNKRESRNIALLGIQLEQEENYLQEENEEVLAEETKK